MPWTSNDLQRPYKREWYKKNRAKVIASVGERRQATAQWLAAHRAAVGCEVCGERHPACLEFHHRDPADKVVELSKTPMLGWGRARILAEMAKCRVLCANCHRKLHWPGTDVAATAADD